MKVFDARNELMPRPQLEQVQLERLQSLLVRLKRYVRRYREQLAKERIESLEDLGRLPLTTADDMAESFPYGMFALPLREVIRLHSTTGPGGNPLVIGHTHNDLIQWGKLVARQLVASGATANDVVQICLGSNTYRGSSGFVLGAELIGASVIAEEPFHTDTQIAMLQNYRPTMLITTPNNALDLAQAMESRKIDPQSLHLHTVLLSRPVDDAVREQLRAGLLVSIQSNFGVEDILDPGLCVECEHGRYHVNEDQFLVEEVQGELVVTTLCREAIPLLRYRTRIACAINREKCACGRTFVSLAPGARLDGRIRVNETALYESQITAILAKSQASGRPFKIEVRERKIEILIEMSSELFSDMMWPLQTMQRAIESEFLFRFGVEAEVHFVGPRTLRP